MARVDALGKTVTDKVLGPPRKYEIRGEHSKSCARKKHPDWAHAMGPDRGCVVDERGVRCDCTAHWREAAPTTRLGQ